MRVQARTLVSLAVPLVLGFTASGGLSVSAGPGPGVGVVPQGLQSDAAYAGSFKANHVTNVFATTQQTSCYTPEVPYSGSLAPADGYTGESACAGAATTGEALGPYPTQAGSNPRYPATTPMLVKDHSESDLRVDPTNPSHLIGSSKWVVSAEGYNHLLGFYESFDGGRSWPVQGHIPGYEGWTDNTDPVGAFDGFGNYYEFVLPYEFYYNSDGSHNAQINDNKEPNPGIIAEVVAVTVHPAATPRTQTATNWITTHDGHTDVVAPYDSKGREPDKQWIAIDTNHSSLHFNRVYVMWAVFDGCCKSNTWISFADARADGTHTDWATPQILPTGPNNPQGDTYVLPHVDGHGTIWTTLTNTAPTKGFCCDKIFLDKSTDGGVTWSFVGNVADDIAAPPLIYANTQFRDGIEDTFVVGLKPLANGSFPLYVSYEDFSAGVDNLMLTMSADGGLTWSTPIQVNDNANPVDEFQPNLAAAANGRISVAFYDRRLACPAAGTAEAVGAGIALDTLNRNFTGSLPPYGASNYCVNSSIQFYDATLNHIGQNIRISQGTWDPQLNSMKPRGLNALEGFIGDYYGNITSGSTDYTTSVSTFDDGSNPNHFQQQVIATVPVP
jgi:hypothetical protein